ncbi:transcriptional regulator NrdR [Candidatus Woesearchaeota archaeon]|jgi:transcriptional repressor NrdR|nr:transcriptional regulator NrdR [Candidatus Woesearchaeota archaeon]MBT6519270.1 transcriptional regulator NrdR [Candidatus Woesearchaeota archaeon]MBT7368462.1 transcriptional regulator NrdR [Candidatus Woesearchaeota archaeon]
MICPYCKSTELKVVDKRDTDQYTRRRRECLKCEKRFTTHERPELASLTLIKKDGTRDEFDRNKILRGMQKACEKLPVSIDVLESATNDIEKEIRNLDKIELPAKTVGKAVMKKLKKIDKVAYLRFASIYLEFEDIDDFEKELRKLVKKNN